MFLDSNCWRFYDTELCLYGNVPSGVLLHLSHNYCRFQSKPGALPAAQRVEGTFHREADSYRVDWGEGLAWKLPRMEADCLAELCIRYTLAQVCSHFLLHAGAVSWQGKGVLLVGRSGSGKTTLTLELLRRGFSFLSDETAALEQTTGLLHPFERLPRLRTTSPYRARGVADGRWHTPIGEPVPVHFLFLLGGETDEAETRRPVTVLCDRTTPGLLAGLRTECDLTDVQPSICQGLPAFSYQAVAAAPPFELIERCCQRQGAQIVDVTEPGVRPDFAAEPVCLPCPTSSALAALLAHLQNGRRSRLFRQLFRANPVLLYTRLARLLSGVACYRLRPGFLDRTANLVCATVS